MSPIFSVRRIAAAACVLAGAAAAPAMALPVIGLTTTNALVTFDSATPTAGSSLMNITGLQAANERILSIDLRPTTGMLYGISSASNVYSLSMSGAASFVGTLSAPLNGSAVGLDFNPAADLSGAASLRVVSSSGQNYAFNVNTGATTVATPISAGLSSVAYSNNDTDASTATSLYYVDTASDTLKVATTAFNNPTITTVGSLGMDVNGVSGFDIGAGNMAYAAFTDADTGKSGLYSINLSTGASTMVGAFGIGGNTAIAPPLLGLAVSPVPEPSTYALMFGGLLAVGAVARKRAKQAR
ncbi:MAG: DUF4394 domain-containing protein [Aquincola tertiaricarbonis]|uniref:DUF4394 domain-containing protein n=1 Tax=Aquincola TaxID=391952 RepID=UPI000615232A|nr:MULTISPECIES: DUF4394 domain-containing protein [Aquincola]MCR5868267.1 DUF4394 domain-containing protein [Aquincola sp. J276]